MADVSQGPLKTLPNTSAIRSKKPSSSSYPELSFITFHDPLEAKTPSQRRAVKSHAASHAAFHHKVLLKGRQHPNLSNGPPSSSLKDGASSKTPIPSKKSRARRRHQEIVLVIDEQHLASSEAGHRQTGDQEDSQVARKELLYLTDTFAQTTSARRTSPIWQFLSQGRVDPFRSYPVPYDPLIPELIDHYLKDMAIDIPELDSGNPGSLRTSWFPLCMTEAPIFQVIILLAASHYSGIRYSSGGGPNLLVLKSRAISAINGALKSSESTTDQLIGAVAKMASYEAMFGDQITFEWHMKGLIQMVELRGGLTALGLGGLLARMCIWIDNNSAFLHNSPLHFTNPQAIMSAEANPSGFLAAR